jgi:hypothetical protein
VDTAGSREPAQEPLWQAGGAAEHWHAVEAAFGPILVG